jgi:hypothetical protein
MHEGIHRGEKPYQCSQYGKTFYQKVHLSKHHATHRRGILKSFLRNQTSGNIREFTQWENLIWQRLAMYSPIAILFSLGYSKLFSASTYYCHQFTAPCVETDTRHVI